MKERERREGRGRGGGVKERGRRRKVRLTTMEGTQARTQHVGYVKGS